MVELGKRNKNQVEISPDFSSEILSEFGLHLFRTPKLLFMIETFESMCFVSHGNHICRGNLNYTIFLWFEFRNIAFQPRVGRAMWWSSVPGFLASPVRKYLLSGPDQLYCHGFGIARQ